MVDVILLSQPTCIPCKMLGQKLEKLLENNSDKMTYQKINIFEDHSYDYLNIQSTPHLIVKKDGEEIYNTHITSPISALQFIQNSL